MQRQNFIVSVLALSASPLLVFSENKNAVDDPGNGFKVNAGEGRLHGHIKLKGVNSNVLDLKISGADTNGGFAMFEQTSVSQGMGTPLHVHHFQNEVFYVVEGNYFFQVGTEKYHIGTGDSIFLPLKVPHAWTQVSEKGKMAVTFQPAGKMENFFLTVAGLDKIPTAAEMAKIFTDNDMQVVGPPLKLE